MSFFSNLFGKSKKAAPSPGEAIQKLRDVEEMLTKKQEFLEKKRDEELLIIKKNGTKNKRVSLQALKRKKRIEKQLEQIDGTLTTIEYQREALENANTNTEVLKIMGGAAKALKQAHDNMDIDKVEDLMDEVREQQQIADEISNVISNPIGFERDVDEDDLMKELEELEQEEIDKQLLETGESEPLPDVPSSEPAKKKTPSGKQKDDAELDELAAWAN
ncbi:Charged multivesicular body protein 4b [Sarcoptes scabiei]|uniref:Charged multivesicular body protein 4b n=1 Tax=Sarcoptes scabiei TaxID=52283 RepID=A0A132A1U9_SARSC|nr:Charged multivesicular body protein 4b [Sarcoptes scabiei]KPM04957.1 charged multivesicular body protein 4b-like protein [Sarcoptes scabiei]